MTLRLTPGRLVGSGEERPGLLRWQELDRRLEIAGRVLSYAVDAAKRTLTVLSIVPTEPG